MNCDDIYLPAVEGDIDLLRERLEMGEVDLNELLDCGVSNGKKTEIPLLFSIISNMLDNGTVNYEVLELLYQYGIDLDGCVKLTDESSIMQIPILVYCLTQWQDTELLKFILKHGAYTNACRTTLYAGGAKERLNLLYFAIANCEGTEEIELLLLHGADPDAGNLVYAQNEAVHQLLPALYYTTAVECSIPKTAALLKFGASLKAKVDTGIGWRHEFALDDYLCEVYPGANRLLWQAYNSVAYGSFRAIRNAYVPGPKQKLKKDEAVKSEENSDPSSPSVQAKSDKKPVADEVKKTETPEDEYSVIRRLAKQLIDFDYSNGSRFLYLDALRKPEHTSLAFLIIGIITGVLFFADLLFFDTFSVLFFIPMVAMLGIYIFAVAKRKKSAKERRAEADRILAQRRQMIGNLNRLSQGKDITPWWSSANGFVIASKKLYRLLVWTPFDRVYHNTANNGLAMKGLCTESDAITGASVMKMLKSDDYRVLINSGIKAENNYKIAELCLWTLIDGTHVYREGMSESEIKSDMAMYNARQDEKERIRNFYEHNCIGMTDEDRYWFSDMSYTDLSRSQFWRQIRTEEYEKKLRNVSYTVIQDKDKYNHFLEPVGVIIFDNADNIVGVLVYRKNFQIERYETDGNKMIYGTTIKSNKFKLDELDMEVIRNLRNYPVAMPDLASRKPETFTDVEWAEFVYACVHEGKILNAIRAEYAEVYEKKRMNIAANSSLLR